MSYLVQQRDQFDNDVWFDCRNPESEDGQWDEPDGMSAIRKAAETKAENGRYRAVAGRFVTEEPLSFVTQTKLVWGEQEAEPEAAVDPEASQGLTEDSVTEIRDEREEPQPEPA